MLYDVSKANSIALKACPVCGGEGVSEWMRAPDRFHGRPKLYALARCSSCALVWTHNPPRPEEMDEHYSPDYNRLIAAAGEHTPNHWTGRRDTIMQHKSGGRLLDLGCSSGSFLGSLKGGPWDLAGIEMSPVSAKRAEAISGAQVFCGDVLAAPFEDNSFDVVTCFHVFEHFYEPEKVMQKVCSWLKPGGIFYSMVPNIDSAGAKVFRSYWFALELPRHLFHFSPESIRQLAHSNGFEVVSIATYREMFIEESVRYIWEDLCRKLGRSPTTLAKAKELSIPWKIVRKLVRMGIYAPLSSLGFLAGDGESIHFILRKAAEPK